MFSAQREYSTTVSDKRNQTNGHAGSESLSLSDLEAGFDAHAGYWMILEEKRTWRTNR